MPKQLAVVYRYGENTVAVIRWEGVPREKLLDSITGAVAQWVTTTDEGKEAWENSNNDFNVGDLCANLADDPADPLNVALAEYGITGLEIETFCDDPADDEWSFDTVLVDESELPDEEDED